MSLSESVCRLFATLALITLATISPAEQSGDTLELARELSFSESWQQARPMLDEIAPLISPDRVREVASNEYHRYFVAGLIIQSKYATLGLTLFLPGGRQASLTGQLAPS